MWTYEIRNPFTGQLLMPVGEPSEKPSFGHRLSGGTKAQTKFLLTKGHVLEDESLTTPWARMLVSLLDGVPRYSGIIEQDPYSESTNELVLHHVDVESALSDVRYPYGEGSYWLDEAGHVPGSLIIEGKSIAAAVGIIVQQCLLGPSANYPLPIVLPDLTEAGDFSTVIQNYNFETLGDHLANFRALGYDIEFEPRLSGAGMHEWVLRVGSAASPSLVEGLVEFNQTGTKRSLKDVTYTRDGTAQLTGTFGVGAGAEVLKRVGGDGLFDEATIMARDAVEYYPNETDEARLAEYGAAAVAAQQFPTYNWSFTLPVSEGFDKMRLGTIVRQFWEKRGRIPEGTHDTRLIGWEVRGDDVVCDVQTWAS